MPKAKADILQGTLDLLILKTLALEPMHGWGISQRIQQISQGVLCVNQGSLYPALHRLEIQGWISASWGNSDNNRQAKFYELTKTGRQQLDEETENWERLSAAVVQVLQAT
jgi:PadR family transcriptional regulator PadR